MLFRSDVGGTSIPFGSAGIGNPIHDDGYVNNGMLLFQGFDVENSAATGNRGLYAISNWELDNVVVQFWCSDFTSRNFGGDPSADFGYDYAENVADFTRADEGQSDINDGYTLVATSGDGSDLAYLGKGWQAPGTDYAKVIFRIEAKADSHDSYFRPMFSFDDLTPSSTTRGNGLDTQAFADHIEAVFHEDGSRWQINIKYSKAGSERAQVGPTLNYPFNPNTPRTFSMTVNTQDTGYVLIRDEDSETTLINQTIAGSGVSAFASYAGGDAMYSQWFIASGSNSVLASTTYLDDPDADSTDATNDDSTCIFFGSNTLTPGGVTIPGDPGTSPPSEGNFTTSTTSTGCGSPFCVDDDSAELPDGWTAQAFNAFLGLLLIAGFMATGKKHLGGGGLTLGVFASLGLVVAQQMGYIQLWVIILLVIVSLALITMRPLGR